MKCQFLELFEQLARFTVMTFSNIGLFGELGSPLATCSLHWFASLIHHKQLITFSCLFWMACLKITVLSYPCFELKWIKVRCCNADGYCIVCGWVFSSSSDLIFQGGVGKGGLLDRWMQRNHLIALSSCCNMAQCKHGNIHIYFFQFELSYQSNYDRSDSEINA